ncbi:MAG: PEP-CTERM sorting domain-containing protein [Phenylobacterium sp.]|nr:PEP-CTERM sorting domain-containing protein [Phenylobacterium sp.]
MSMTVFGQTVTVNQAGYGPFDHTEGYAFPDFGAYSNDYAQGTFAFWGYVGHSTGPFMTANLYTDDYVPGDVSTPFTAHRVAGYSGLAQILLPGADHFVEGSTDMLVVTKLRDSAPVGGVPEPATWALMILGFGAAGSMLRRRERFAGA